MLNIGEVAVAAGAARRSARFANHIAHRPAQHAATRATEPIDHRRRAFAPTTRLDWSANHLQLMADPSRADLIRSDAS
jgi:hypothetical protein